MLLYFLRGDYSNTGLAASTAYFYRVRAVNGTVYSSYSNEVNEKTNIASFTIPLYMVGTAFGYSCKANSDVRTSPVPGCAATLFRLSRKWTFRPLDLRVNQPLRKC